MHTGNVTTPFGRRPMTLALVRGQMLVAEAKPVKPVDKWKVFRDVCQAREKLGLQDRALTVLDALLSFYPDTELSGERPMVVFPSNAQLSLRAHGITATTLRRHLAGLVEAGLIQRRDSPNGKRYVHRDRDGEIEQAYGFDLSPLLARSAEMATIAYEVTAERLRIRRLREALTICRRDVRKLISAAVEEGAQGDWAAAEDMYVAIIARLPRNPEHHQIAEILDEMEMLRLEVLNMLETQLKEQIIDGNDRHFGCHIQNSKPESIRESEQAGEKEKETIHAVVSRLDGITAPSFPLGMILRACPQIIDYGPNATVGNWRELTAAAVVVRSTLGVSPSAYQEACEVMGPENAATAIACILERAGHIHSAGGYLRELTRKASRGEFGLGPALMALMRTNSREGWRSA